MSKKCICPVCHHEETVRARRLDDEPCYDDSPMMHWHGRRGGTGAACVNRLDAGYWNCWKCGVILTPREASVFVDAALYASHPDCDSIGEEGFHIDTEIAAQGGRDDD